MLSSHAIRFAKKEFPIPNIEFKVIKINLDKLFLGSQKDLEDVKHLYDVFKENIDKDELMSHINKLSVKGNFDIIKEDSHETRYRKVG